MHAGQEVVALYEVELHDGASGSIGTIRVRHQEVESDEVVETTIAAPAAATHGFEYASPRFRLAASVAAFAEVLRDSYWAKQTTLAEIREVSSDLTSLDTELDNRITEFLSLVAHAEALIQARKTDELSRLLEHYKSERYQREILYDFYERTDQLETQKGKLEACDRSIERLESELHDRLAG